MIKTISLDLWGTLITSNPNYQEAKINFLQNFTDKSVTEITDILQSVKLDVDLKAEILGLHLNTDAVYKTMFNLIQPKKLTIEYYHSICETLMIINLPKLLPHTLHVLKFFKDKYQLIIASNNVLMNGLMMRKVLDRLQLLPYFKHCVFSDEVDCSKPNTLFFKKVHEFSGSLSNQILHIGDNLVTDMQGANNYGFHGLLLPSGFNDHTALEQLSIKLDQINNS